MDASNPARRRRAFQAHPSRAPTMASATLNGKVCPAASRGSLVSKRPLPGGTYPDRDPRLAGQIALAAFARKHRAGFGARTRTSAPRVLHSAHRARSQPATRIERSLGWVELASPAVCGIVQKASRSRSRFGVAGTMSLAAKRPPSLRALAYLGRLGFPGFSIRNWQLRSF